MANFSKFFDKIKKGDYGKARAAAKQKYNGQDQSEEAKAARQKSRDAKKKKKGN